MSSGEMSELTRSVLEEAAEELERTELSGGSKLIARSVLRSLKALRGRTDVLSNVQRLQREVSGISAVLTKCATQLSAAEEAEAAREPEGDTWWKLRDRRVSAAFKAGTPDAADLWASTWMNARR